MDPPAAIASCRSLVLVWSYSAGASDIKLWMSTRNTNIIAQTLRISQQVLFRMRSFEILGLQGRYFHQPAILVQDNFVADFFLSLRAARVNGIEACSPGIPDAFFQRMQFDSILKHYIKEIRLATEHQETKIAQ
jgi:hypothetical protein